MVPYTIMFYEKAHPNRRTIAWLGDTPPTPTGGGGGWTKVPRPKRAAITFWTGRDNTIQMSIPIVLGSNLDPITSVVPDRTALADMFRPTQDHTEPPVIKIMSPGDIVPYQSLSYVITDLQWGDGSADAQGNRTLQKLVVMLDEYVPDVRLVGTKIKKVSRKGFSYHVKKGDTLSSIARKFKIKGGWQALGKAQNPPITDPRKKLPKTIFIPATLAGVWLNEAGSGGDKHVSGG